MGCVWLCTLAHVDLVSEIVYYSTFFTHSASDIQQMYPSNPSYCCHCPNIELRCKFSENPISAYWSVIDNGNPVDVTDSTTGHTLDTSEMHSGTLRLEVNDTKYSRNKMYTCTALYVGEGLEIETSHQPFMVPTEES